MYFAENMKDWQLVYDVLTLGAAEFEIFLGNLVNFINENNNHMEEVISYIC